MNLKYAGLVFLLISVLIRNAAFGQEGLPVTAVDSTLNIDSLFEVSRSLEDHAALMENKPERLMLIDSAIRTRQVLIDNGKSKELALQYQVEAFEKYTKLLLDTKATKDDLKKNYLRTISALEQWTLLDHTIEKIVLLANANKSIADLEEGNEEGLHYMVSATGYLKNATLQMPEDSLLANRLSRYYELTTWKSLRLNKAKEAKSFAQEAIAHNPGHMRMHSILAIAYFLLKKSGKTQKLIIENRVYSAGSDQLFNQVMLRDFLFLEQLGLFPDQMKADAEKIKALLQINEPQ